LAHPVVNMTAQVHSYCSCLLAVYQSHC